MSIIQDKLGNEFLRNGGMDPNFAPGMLMFSHLPPVTSFTRLTSQSVMGELPQEMVLKKERDSPPDHHGASLANASGFLHSMGIKQERLSELDYRMPLYGGGGGGGVPMNCAGAGKSGDDMPDMSYGNHHQNHHNMLLHDLTHSNVRSLGEPMSGRSGKEPKDSSGKRGRRTNGDGQGGKARRKRNDAAKGMMLDADGACLSPNSKPHICEHCNAAFRSSYHLRRHVLIHTDRTGERPFRCSQCNMSFIQKYLLQRHEKIHSGEKPFSCDQCNMRFIQKYHMERHKRTHSGEKPYRCDTCQQFFSRTDRLLKHKRTCGEAIKKGLDPNMLELSDAELGQGSYSLTQGNATTSGRKRAKSKNGEGGERKRKKNAAASMAASSSAAMARDIGLQDYSMEQPSGSAMQGRSPKLVFKKAGRKGLDKVLHSLEDSADGQKLLGQKAGGMDHVDAIGLDNMGLLQGGGSNKQGPATSSNYDDAMQFVKKRRYLHAVNNDYGAGALHMASQGGSVIQVSLGPEPTLTMLDTSPLELKHDKSGIPDEVLQSLLEHYSHKPEGAHHHEVAFDLSDHPHHVDLQPAAPVTPELEDEAANGSDKTAVMSEYSKFLLQALERTSHSGPFPSLGATGPFPLLSSSSSPTGPLFSDKHVYSTSPLDCGYPPAVSSPLPIAAPSSTTSSTSSKSHYGMLVGSPSQSGFHLTLEPASHQQLTPSQELTEQLEKQHSPGAFNLPPQDLTAQAESSKGQQAKAGGSATPANGSSYSDLSPLNPPKESTTYQIENFAQAFGSQFKSGRRTPLSYGSDPGAEVDHRIRTPVSEFSGYTSLLADVSEPVSTGSKTPTSQSFR
ncbi:zinc finger protein 281b isoform X1 [Phyllopteryx taeniolatus]|uniref:zinc finger protein 281b isoform X1 n=1 Tax=Phyllopteryx taeniolatus TaxID=161469 RepID=UPI002AD24C98|nr:zinc finger protein 281b isoform X1 [Phyllopteryx taeniolatus]XP_061611942.1 zinc finger protein 281b isoform X1 [Phyllopteryx taeniolatus]XP_061611943.1 zinc finger protein 281b isoform X1 [Phyllopteryx taeniolatus]XP_061611944.1 zinc finger protein 281b isoform X1 [Phyllopteryx taeniolatus]